MTAMLLLGLHGAQRGLRGSGPDGFGAGVAPGIDLGAYEAWASRLVRVQDDVVMRPGEPLCPGPRELLRLLVEQHGTDSSPSRRQAVTEGRS